MSTKHNCKHPDRSKSGYGRRLTARGLSKAPALTPLDTLRHIQERRIAETCTNASEHRHGTEEPRCDGVPWYQGNPAGEKLLADIFGTGHE